MKRVNTCYTIVFRNDLTSFLHSQMQAVFCKMENKQPKAFVISFLFISIIFFHLCASYRVITFNFVRDFPSSSDRACTKPSIWREKVNYVDPNKVIEESTEGRQSLPLFLLSGVFYPQGSTVLNIFEMKYR